MARLRFPGRPGYRFDRLGVRYGADEARNVNDPSLAIVAYIHHGLRKFRELFGESDEEEEFDGFSAKEVKVGEKKLERVTNELIKELFDSGDVFLPPSSAPPKSTRFSQAKADLDSLPTSERTRGRVKTVVRKSYKQMVKEGLVKASKSHVVASVKEVERMKEKARMKLEKHKLVKGKHILIGQRKDHAAKIKQAAIRVKLKKVDTDSKSPKPRGRPPKLKPLEESPKKVGRPKKIVTPEKPGRKKLPLKVVCVPKSKQTDKKMAKQLLDKAKKGRLALQNRLPKPGKVKADGLVHTPKPKKEFVLPTVSSRSSRVIIPNKRFIEEDVYYEKAWKKPKMDKTPESPSLTKTKENVERKLYNSPVSKTMKSPELLKSKEKVSKKKKDHFTSPSALCPVLHPKGANSVSLFSSVIADNAVKTKNKKALVVEGKRQRKPSLKMRMKKTQLTKSMKFGGNLLLDVDESSSASQESSQGSSENSNKSVDLFPKSVGASAGVSVFSRAGPMSLPGIRQRADGKGHESLAAKRSGDNILRKAKLQLNRVAVNRSKAALARSLKAQMKKEAKLQRQQEKKSKFSPQSPTSPHALSPISGSRGFLDMPGSPPPRPLFDNNNIPVSPDKAKPMKEKKTPKRGTHISPKVMSSLAAKLASPTKHLEMMEEEEQAPPGDGTSRGPRIKHVCRRAAMVLPKPAAKFPSPPSLRLSALPSLEKEKIIQDEIMAHANESSDDERPMEEIIKNASTVEATVLKRTPSKPQPSRPHAAKVDPATFPFTKTGRRRKIRCRECKGCLSEDCGVCMYCLDKPKFGGRSVLKQACIERRCENPKYAKVASTFVLRNIKSNKDHEPDDDNSPKDGDGRLGYSSKSSHNSTGTRRLPVVKDGDGKKSGASNTPPMSNAAVMDGEKRLAILTQARRIARAKEKAVTSQKASTALLKPISTGSNRSCIPSTDTHRIKVDFRETYAVEEAWQQGMALSMLGPACIRTVCYLCASAGKHDLIYCMVCCEPFHTFCLDEDERPDEDNTENWCCRHCQFCNVCGHQNHLLRCDRCQSTYHPECLGPSYPTRPSKKNIWVCTKCVKCKSCGATTPGVGTNATWTYDFSLCYDCGRLMDKGNFCPICHKCYSDDDWESKMIQCAACESWVHAKCEQLSDEMYQLLSYLPDDVQYTCRICTREHPAPWECLLQAEFMARLKTVLFNLFSLKSAQHLLRADEKKERRSSEKKKASPRTRSPAKSITPISMTSQSEYTHSLESTPRAITPSSFTLESDMEKSSENVSRAITPIVSRDPILERVANEIEGQSANCDKILTQNRDNESETIKRTSPDSDRNIFKLIDECLHGESSMSDEHKSDENASSIKTSDNVSKETRNCDIDTNVPSTSEAMEVDSSVSELDKEVSSLTTASESMNTKTVDNTSESRESVPTVDPKCAINTDSEENIQDLSSKDSGLVTPVVMSDTSLQTSSAEKSDLPQSSSEISGDQTEKVTTPTKNPNVVGDEANTMKDANNTTPTKLPQGESSLGSDKSSEKKKNMRDFPPDFESVRLKLDSDKYISVEEFNDDMVHIIQTALSDPEEQTHMKKKFNNSVRSVFVKQMEKCFPWFNINTCKLWEHNKSLPETMLPDAVLPPSEDHTYAQWLERVESPLSPQPSPFKRLQIGTGNKIVPMGALEGEKTGLDHGGDDLRMCLLCSSFGDDLPNERGRLLYINHDDWVHVNCALWSAEVFEETDGTLQNVHIALGRGRLMRCDRCSKGGATVGCCHRTCSANYHFQCARIALCVFQEDKKVYCKQHTDQVDGEVVKEGNFKVLRRVCIDTHGKYNKKTWNKGVHPSLLNILIGSCTIESLGHLGPLSDTKGCLLPIDFMCTRVYWSTQDARRRCVYTCRIVEVRPNPISPEVKIRDMRIVHDEQHPEFVPMADLDKETKSILNLLSPGSMMDLTVSETTLTACPELAISQKTLNISTSSSTDTCDSSEIPKVDAQNQDAQNQKFDLNILSPNTLRALGRADLQKYVSTQSNSVTVKPRVDDFGYLNKMVERLNQAAGRSTKSEDRTFRAVSPPTMPRIKRSSSCDVPPFGRHQHQTHGHITRPYSPAPPVTQRPASVAAMPITIKVKVRPSIELPTDQPMRISVDPHQALTQIKEKSDVIVIDEEGEINPATTNEPMEATLVEGETTPVGSPRNEPMEQELMMSPEEKIQQVLDSVPQDILDASDGQTIVIMTDGGDISEEEAMLLAQAALEEKSEVLDTESSKVDEVENVKDTENTEKNDIEETENTEKKQPCEDTDEIENTEKKQPCENPEETENTEKEKFCEYTEETENDEIRSNKTEKNQQCENIEESENDETRMKKSGEVEVTDQPVGIESSETGTLVETDSKVRKPIIEIDADTTCIEKTVSAGETSENKPEAPKTSTPKKPSICKERSDGEISVSKTLAPLVTKQSTENPELPKTPEKSQPLESPRCGKSPGSPRTKKLQSPTSGTIDRKVVEKHGKKVGVYKDGVLIGWKIHLPEAGLPEDEGSHIGEADVKTETRSDKNSPQKEKQNIKAGKTEDDSEPLEKGEEDFTLSLEIEDEKEENKMDVSISESSCGKKDVKEEGENSDAESCKGTKDKPSHKKGSTPIKTYPLRRTSQRLSDHGPEKPQELPLHDKIAQKIKAESLAKSSPGVQGPFKCRTCKRLYRTKESFTTHVENCDFEVSTSEEEEEEETKERYPTRSRHRSLEGQKSLEGQSCVVKLTDIKNETQFDKYRKDKETPVKRSRGRPPKKKILPANEKMEDIEQTPVAFKKITKDTVPKEETDVKESDVVTISDDDEEESQKPVLRQTRSNKRKLSDSSQLTSVTVQQPESLTNVTLKSPEVAEPAAKRGRGRPPRSSTEISDICLKIEDQMATGATPKAPEVLPVKAVLSKYLEEKKTCDDTIKDQEPAVAVKDSCMSPEYKLCEVTGMLKNKFGKVKVDEKVETQETVPVTVTEMLQKIADGVDVEDVSPKKKRSQQKKSPSSRKKTQPISNEIAFAQSEHPSQSVIPPQGTVSVSSQQVMNPPEMTHQPKNFNPPEMIQQPKNFNPPRNPLGVNSTKQLDTHKKLNQPVKGTPVQNQLKTMLSDTATLGREDNCPHVMDTTKSTDSVSYYVVYPPQGCKKSDVPAHSKKNTPERKKQNPKSSKSPKSRSPKSVKSPVKITPPKQKAILPSSSQSASNASFSGPSINKPPPFPQPLMIPQPKADNSDVLRTSPRNIFDVLQGQPMIGNPPVADVQTSIAQLTASTILTPSISIHQTIPQMAQPLTINTSPQSSITALAMPQRQGIIPRILQQPSSVLSSPLSQIQTPIIQNQNIIRPTLPVVSQSTIIQSQTILGSNILTPQPQISQPGVLVPQANQQVLPTNLISQLGSLLPGQLTPQQATVMSRLNIQNQQTGMEYMGSFLLDQKSPQPLVSLAQTSPVLTPSLSAQQTQQILNLVSGSAISEGVARMLNQSLLSSGSPGLPAQISPSLGLKSLAPASSSSSDTVLHSNLIRHYPDGKKTVVCSPGDTVKVVRNLQKSTITPSPGSITVSTATSCTQRLREMLNDKSKQQGASLTESSVRPHQLVHRPGGPINKGFSVLKKILKPAILHRKRPSLMVTIKKHLAMSPEKNGVIQGNFSDNIRNSLEGNMKETTTQPTEYYSSSSAPREYFTAPPPKSTLPAPKTLKKKKVVVKEGKVKKINKKDVPRKTKAGISKRKTAHTLRNVQEKYKEPGASSHPLIHHQKEVMSLPQPEIEEEVRETPMMPFFDINNQNRDGKHKDRPHLMFEITSDDGFKCTGESMEDAWRQVTERVQDARAAARMKALSYVGLNSVNMFGLNNNTVVYLLEQLLGAKHCHRYNFCYFQHTLEKVEEETPVNASGCIRCEPFESRKPYDMFSFLMSEYRYKPHFDSEMKNVEMNLKSQRRATSMDLPMAMRFRKLQAHAKEAVGAYRSLIHGRGLFCKRNIDSGEMVIEYAGEVIRATLTDKREKYYESKGIGCYMFRIDDFEVVDATMHGNAARFINHSCEPNCYSRVINVDGKKHIVIFAMRSITRGEELTYDYKFPIEEVKIPCSCGSKKCRRYLN